MTGNPSTGPSAFRDGDDIFYNNSPTAAFFAISWATERVEKRGGLKANFASGYARSDAFEDFAETFAAYTLHRPMLEKRATTNAAIAAKLTWMETYLPLEENIFGPSSYSWTGKTPWDITLLPYAANLTQ